LRYTTLLGLGLAAGAVFHPLRAQVDTGRVRRDTTVRITRPRGADSIVLRDSTKGQPAVPLPVPHDTTKAPLAHAPIPRMLPSERSLRMNRQEMFATGALTMQDLLERVMGVSTISLGFVAAPAAATVAGDVRRVRVFVDGIEYDPLDARGGDILDLSQIPIWLAEDVTIERAALETRVHMRTWRVDRTDDYTRTDIGTGDQQINLYRAFYGKRMQRGVALQLGAQQYGTTPPNYLGSSADQLGLMTRIGWAGTDWSVDGTFMRVSRNRGDILAFGRRDTIDAVKSKRNEGYLRVGFRDPDTSRVWGQVVASPTTYNFQLPPATSTTTDTIRTDTTRSQLQVLAGLGTNRGPLSLQAMARIRRWDSVTLVTPVVSASYSSRGIGARASWESVSRDSLARMDAVAEVLPIPYLRLGGAVDRIQDRRANSLASTGLRAWGGLRLKEVWFDLGVLRRDSVVLPAPVLVGATDDSASGPATGLTASIEGRVWRSLFANLWAVRWMDSSRLLRPEYQSRSELFIRTNLPERFPRGNFSFLLSVRHEYRSKVLFPMDGAVLPASGEHAITSLLEIRIATAVVSWQVRNVVGSRNYLAPDYLRPRTTNFYGVRWEFWN
jgi:hypothetical protein